MALASCALVALGLSLAVATARRRAADQPPDPFRVLDVQLRLARLADEVRRVEAQPAMLARAHHLRAALEAYDAVLAEACALAQTTAGPAASDDLRLDRELLLSARGWSW